LGGLKGRDHWEDLGVGGSTTLRWTWVRKVSIGWTGFGWLRIGSSGRLLWTQYWTFRFHRESWLFFDKMSNYKLFKEYPILWNNKTCNLTFLAHFWMYPDPF
jgi:hypothetical protein